jgi:glycyl-tRNA synthetase beta chain
MNYQDFLFELGFEEIPAAYIQPAVKAFVKYIETKLKYLELQHAEIVTYSTPRRLAITIDKLQTKQADKQQERVGPSVDVAYDKNGDLTKAGEGFLRSADAQKDDVYTIETGKGKKIAVSQFIKGEDTSDILSGLIPEAVSALNFPKTMRWNKRSLWFARPIRWMLCMYGDTALPLKYGDINSDEKLRGNRFCKEELTISKIADYEQELEKVYVVACRAKRKQKIEEQLRTTEKGTETQILRNTQLLEEVTDLVEFPTATIASFDEKFLGLPEEIITTTLSYHQKYFAMKTDDGKLTNSFVFVSNGDPQYSELIAKGNQRVVNARLEDAQFYFDEDTKNPLETYVSRLKDVTFHADLGSMYKKTERIMELSAFVSQKQKLSEQDKNNVKRAAYLCKADLVSLMLGEKEFTRLQGYIGMKYAELSGEEDSVAQAIYEHYMPRGSKDDTPETLAGAVVAIADKIDTICGIISCNDLPTGSNDPYALRRAANGIIRIIENMQFDLNIYELIDRAYKLLDGKNSNKDKVYEFIQQRIDWHLQKQGFSYDIIDSVMHIDHSNVKDLIKRAQALQNYKDKDEFITLVLGFKRVSNIIADCQKIPQIDPNLFSEKTEMELHRKTVELSKTVNKLLETKNYAAVLQNLVDFRVYIDQFFDDVLVNCEDEKVSLNRYGLLYEIRKLFLSVADLNKLVVEEKK